MLNNKIKRTTSLAAAFFILTALCGCAGGEKTAETAKSLPPQGDARYSALSNTFCGWGFRRTDSRPEFTPQQTEKKNKYNCIYMGSEKEKALYLTFDEGYENGYTSLILDTLKEKSVPAAFFVTGPYVKGEPELIMRMAKEGHIIGNHTVNHPSLPSVSTVKEIYDEVNELDRLVYGVCKQRCKYLRPPKGEYSERTLAITNDLGYINTFWSLAYVDWKNDVSAAEAEKNVLSNLHNGCVLLLHAVSKGNADALANIIDKARTQGYEFKSLDEY